MLQAPPVEGEILREAGEAAEAAADSTISVKDLKVMLDERAEGARDFVLIDVREPAEYEIVDIPGSVLIPKGQFLDGSVLPTLPQDKQIVLHCKSGRRSAECLALLRDAGFMDSAHLSGGILQWIDRVEPDKSRY